jgi:hypothetical protein
LAVQLHCFLSLCWVCKLNVAESTLSAILTNCNPDLRHIAGLSEEVSNGLFFSVETNVTAENGRSDASCARGWAWLACSFTTWLIARVLNGDCSTVEVHAVVLSESSCCVCALGVFNEGNALALSVRHDELALGELSVLREVSIKHVLVYIE